MSLEAKDKQSWSVIVPCYNEKGTITNVIKKIQHVLDQIASEYEVIPIDDGSVDGSVSLIQKLAAEDSRVVPFYHERNKGIGIVLRTGYLRARYENVVAIGGDDQFDPTELIAISPIPPKTFVAFYRNEVSYRMTDPVDSDAQYI